MKPPRASSVSHQLHDGWESLVPTPDFPIVEGGGSTVLVEGDWRTLGWAAHLLAQRGDYVLAYAGQWFEQSAGDDVWIGWVEVSR